MDGAFVARTQVDETGVSSAPTKNIHRDTLQLFARWQHPEDWTYITLATEFCWDYFTDFDIAPCK